MTESTLIIVAAASAALTRIWAWTGFKDRTLGDWLKLLNIPLTLFGPYVLLFIVQDDRQKHTKDDRANADALQAYYDKMAGLLRTQELKKETETGLEARSIARAGTLATVRSLDGTLKGSLLRFLHESELINDGNVIVDLDGADLSFADLNGTKLRAADLSGADLSFADLSGVILSFTVLRRCDLRGVGLSGADLRRSDLGEADLSAADMSGADLRGAFLGFATLRGANLLGSSLSGVDLIGADLRRSDLGKADLSFADLREVNLNFADLRRSDLHEADLRGAKLRSANLGEADLTRADLSFVDLRGAKYDSDTLWPFGFDPERAGAKKTD